eukprot:Platyproteum_vivax@DN12813_c0_g1_i1.p2
MTDPSKCDGYQAPPITCHPSLFLREYQTPAFDVWGLGVLLYEMLTGRAPFTAEYYDDLASKVVNESVQKPKEIHTKLVWDLICQMLSKDPRQRPTIGEVLEHPWLADPLAGLKRDDTAEPKVSVPSASKVRTTPPTLLKRPPAATAPRPWYHWMFPCPCGA